ncbi:MAG: putative membrane transporter protein [Promethearchaeota archaeon]|nr:MAG: putative membrane transporter protein [Candidatus Lokiarchaeota archaeon]
MEISIDILVIIIILGFIGAFIDNAFGMGFGTLTPILTAMGFKPIVVVPVLLIAQMSSGLSGSIFHAIFRNVELDSKEKRDVKVTVLLTVAGMIGMTAAIFLAINLNELAINIYIGVMILIVGIIMVKEIGFHFSWSKMYIISGLASFNKAISGGGYGPITTSGQVISGRDHEESVATSVISESFLSGYGFLLYYLFEGFQNISVTIDLMIVLIISAVIATPLGALTADRLNKGKAKKIIGYVSIVLGIFTLIRLFWYV